MPLNTNKPTPLITPLPEPRWPDTLYTPNGKDIFVRMRRLPGYEPVEPTLVQWAESMPHASTRN
ncbi:MAG: hypothetical protein Tsb006_7270 [Rickettsiaceae bacterium]